MLRPDFREYKNRGATSIHSAKGYNMPNYKIAHSAKGSEWKKHKYLREHEGKYYYPDSYEGGRHLPKGGKDGNGKTASLPKETDGKKKSSGKKLSNTTPTPVISDEIAKKSVSELALDVVSGKLGNVSQYKEALGSRYEKVQERVKEIANKAGIIEASKKETAAKKQQLAKRKPRSASQTEKKTQTLSKEELDEELRAKKLQAKMIIKTDEKKESPENKTPIQNEIKTTSKLSRAKAASDKTNADKLAESVVNKNASKLLEEALKKAATQKVKSTSSSSKPSKKKK